MAEYFDLPERYPELFAQLNDCHVDAFTSGTNAGGGGGGEGVAKRTRRGG